MKKERPLLLTIDRAKEGPKGALLGEEAGAAGRTSATVEEVMAAHQAWRSFQDERLQNTLREGEMTFRTRFGQINATVDITVRADYFWERATGADWSIRETLFNGVRLDWKKFPELPIIGRDAVLALPLELNFDKRYVYRREDVDEVAGRRCWRVAFEPAGENDGSLYRGRAWIEQRGGALVRVSRVQLTLRPPLISDEETQTYRPFEGPDGTSYWLLDDIDGQQIYTVSIQPLWSSWRMAASTTG